MKIIRKYFELKVKHNITNLWDAAEVVLRGKFRALNVHIRKEERAQINDLRFYLKLEKEEQNKPKISRG